RPHTRGILTHIVKYRIRCTAILRVQHIEGLCLELKGESFADLYVLEHPQINGANRLTPKGIPGGTFKGRTKEQRGIILILNPVHGIHCGRKAGYEINNAAIGQSWICASTY